MSTAQTQPLRLQPFGYDSFTTGMMEINFFTGTERIMRGLKFFLIFFILALASVLLPVLHFVLVPLFAILAPTSAVAIFLQKNEIHRALGECPYCKKSTALSRARTTLPFRDSCEHCRQLIEVRAGI